MPKFKLALSPTFKAPITFQVLDAEGKTVEIAFTGIFRRKTQAEVDELIRRGAGDDETVRAVLAGWENGPVDDQDVPLPFTAEHLETLLAGVHGVRALIARTFFEANSAATRKN